MQEHKLGVQVKDVVTGFEGTAIAYVQYLTGCNQYLVVPKCVKKHDKPDGEWFDESRMQSAKGKAISLKKELKKATTGADIPAPKI